MTPADINQWSALSSLRTSIRTDSAPSTSTPIRNVPRNVEVRELRFSNAMNGLLEVSICDSPFRLYPDRGRDTSHLMPPAQIPACGFPAPGSSDALASVEGRRYEFSRSPDSSSFREPWCGYLIVVE